MGQAKAGFCAVLLLGYLHASTAHAQPAPAAKVAESKSGEVLFSFANGHVVTATEFETVFRKNLGQKNSKSPLVPRPTREQVRAYLDLYVNFNRKVMEATRLGLDTTTTFRDELKNYVSQLSQSYLFEKEVLNDLIDEAYRRSQTEVRAHHVLLALPKDAQPEDTQRVYKKLMALRDSITRGLLTFPQVANRYSDDTGTRNTGGDLGFFSVLDMVYPFETGAYTIPVGQLSMPVRSQFGYHLIFVQNRIPYQGNRRVAHIVVLHTDAQGKRDTLASLQKIEEVYRRLLKGERFDSLARHFSQDPNTATNGGDLGANRLFPSLEEAKRYLNLHEYSRPLYTPYGWHIIKVTELFPIQSYDEARLQLKNRILKDARVRTAENRLVSRLRKQYHYKPNKATENSLLQYFADYKGKEATVLEQVLPTALQQQTLFAFDNSSYNVAQFVADCKTRSIKFDQPEQVFDQIDRFTSAMLLRYEESTLPARSAEFRELAREYHDGILLFTLMEQKVWRPAVEDSVGLHAFYAANPAKFESAKPEANPDAKSGAKATADAFEAARPEIVKQYQQKLEEDWLRELAARYPVTINEKALNRLFR